MDKLVMLKSSRYGLEIHLNPQAEFSKLLREMERKLKASIKFFEGAKMAVEFKDRLLSQAEEDQLLELISKTAGIDVVCIIDRNQTKEMAYKSVIAVSYTHLDVYKRQDYSRTAQMAVRYFKKHKPQEADSGGKRSGNGSSRGQADLGWSGSGCNERFSFGDCKSDPVHDRAYTAGCPE